MENNGYADLYTATHSGSRQDATRNLILAIAYGQERDERGAPSQLTYQASEWHYAALVIRDDRTILYPPDGAAAVAAARRYLADQPGPRSEGEIARNRRTRERMDEIFGR